MLRTFNTDHIMLSAGLHINTQGVVLGTPRYEYYRGLADEVRAIRTAVELQIPRQCLSEHESRIEAAYNTEAQFNTAMELVGGLRIITDRLLCSDEQRRNNPNCAHVVYSELEPDPFGPELEKMARFGILQCEDWQSWYRSMCEKIRLFDRTVMGKRWSQPKLSKQHLQDLQAPIVEENLRVKQLLLDNLTMLSEKVAAL